MKLYSLINENQVLLGAPVATLTEALERLLDTFAPLIDADLLQNVRRILLQRETQHPTCIMEGVCIPHVRLPELEHFLVGVIVPEHPIPHPNPELPPVGLIFVVLAPQGKNAMMLQTLAAITRLLKSKETHQALMGVKAPARLLRVIEDTGIDVKKTLVAADIMSPIAATIDPNAPLTRAVDVLVTIPDEGIPVVDDQGRLIGELTSKELLALGMPQYMDLMVNPVMLDNFEPFENYFRHESTMTVRELCRRDVITVPPSMPIVQVTHLMMTRHRRRIYVMDDGQLKGVIYRKGIVTKVLHY